ncbi:MAG: DUF4266 domain-containing protein [Chryseolinea sp.]
MKSLFYVWLCSIVIALPACESVKPYQRAYLNDHEMQPGQSGALRFDDQVQAYREASSGGGSSKVSGGCGCN